MCDGNSGKVQSVALFVFCVMLGRGNPLLKRFSMDN